MERRFGDDARIVYHDVAKDDARTEHKGIIDEIDSRGLLYPVTVIGGVPLYDGAVSYPAIIKAVSNKLAKATAG